MSAPGNEKSSGLGGDNEVRRLHTHQIEIGVTDAVQRHVQRHVIPQSLSARRSLTSSMRGRVG